MLAQLIRFSLKFRGFVLVVAGLLLVAGGLVAMRTPVDVLPDLTAPSVTVLTEAAGYAPEEVELLVTFPLESVLNGAQGVRRIRSVSGAGVSVIWIEFDWGQDVYLARQIISERLQEAELPDGVSRPRLGPVSSIMGEITFLALTSKELSAGELRRVAETDVRRALLAIPGIAQVVPIGGDIRQYQVLLDPPAMNRHRVGVLDVVRALEKTSATTAAGFHVDDSQEYLVRGLGRTRSAADLASTVVTLADGIPVTVGMVGRVERDEHLQGVNGAEIEVVLRSGRSKDELLAGMRRAVGTIPGVAVTFGQPISHRIDHMISGSKAQLAVKIFGSDLSVLRRLASTAEQILGSVPGIVDLSNQEQATVPQLALDFDRAAMARNGLLASDLARSVEALFQGTQVGEILEDGIVTSVVVRLAEGNRRHRDDIKNMLVLTEDGRQIRLGDVARVR